MAALAMWMQDTATGGFSPRTEKWILIFLGVIAFSMLVQALVYIVGGLVALKAVKELKSTVDEVHTDAKASIEEVKAKVYPLVDGILHAGRAAQNLMEEAAPKVKVISDHLVETSRVVRDSAEKLSHTVAEVNQRAQRQAARVDGMVTAALDTTAEIVATVEHGIKVPAKKIAETVTQARYVAEGVLARIKAMASGLPFMQSKGQAGSRTGTAAGAGGPRGPVGRPAGAPPVSAHTPASATGPVPLVK